MNYWTNYVTQMNNFFALLAGILVFTTSTAQKSVEYQIVPTKSEITWIGKKLTGEHSGTITVSQGNLFMQGDAPTGGQCTVDMRSITVTDIPANDPGNAKLKKHLENKDFFDVEQFPNAILNILSLSKIDSKKYEVKGNLTIKGITKPVTFTLEITGKTKHAIVMRAHISIDRTQYGIVYKSSTLGEMVINDQFSLDVKLVASRK